MQLYNTLSAKEREALIEEAGQERLTISFYQYAHIGNPVVFRNHLFIHWNDLDVLGRIYVANEGINAQLSVAAENFEEFKSHLDSISFLKDVRLNIAIEQDNKSFLKLKVKVRKKILADGLNDATFDVTNKGVHVNAEKFNELIEDPNTIFMAIKSEPPTPRLCQQERETLVEIRKKLDAHIKKTYLRRVQAPIGIKPVLRTWMELN
jgi:UPF0176 protein